MRRGISCLKNLRAENENLLEQDRLLRTKAAQLYAKVELIKEDNKTVGYGLKAKAVFDLMTSRTESTH